MAENFQEHGIDGETFLLMSDDELKEVAPRMADRMKLKKLRDVEVTEKVCSHNTTIAIKFKPVCQSVKNYSFIHMYSTGKCTTCNTSAFASTRDSINGQQTKSHSMASHLHDS